MSQGSPQYTDEQASAITTRAISVAISAGAGCGKTFVLTERYLAELDPSTGDLENVPELQHLVAITFTERAAREMRDRIRAKLFDRLSSAEDEAVADHWQRLIRELDSARISTIHSFCTSVLRSSAVEARLDPQFTVLDQTEAETLLSETIDDCLRERLAEQHPDTLELIYHFRISGLRDRVRGLLNNAPPREMRPWREATTGEILDAWEAFHRRHVLPAVLGEIAESELASQVLNLLRTEAPETDRMQLAQAVLGDRLSNLLQSNQPAEDLLEIVDHAKMTGVTRTTKKEWENEVSYEAYRDACKKLRDVIKEKLPMVTFDRVAAEPAAEVGRILLCLCSDMSDEYRTRKEQQGQLDFNDLLEETHALLTGPYGERVRSRIGDQISLLMVDEFQDTDPIQDQLVRMLCGDALRSGKLFFVGDFKQSIYKFRGARPDIFRQLQDDMHEQGRLPLSQNFRSQPAILEFVNALFHDAFGDGYQPLRPFREQVAPRPAIEFLWVEAGDEKRGKGVTRENRKREADWIARRIRALIDEADPIVWTDPAGDENARSVRPGDVALLFRSLSDVDIYEEALRKYGLAYYLVGGHAFYSRQEVYDLMNLLRSLVSRCDEVSLAGVLRSPFFSLTDETLFWLAQHEGGLSQGLFELCLPEQLDEVQLGRTEFAAKTLSDLRDMKDRLPVADLIHEALARTGYDAILLGEFLGERKLANLHKLIHQARSFDRVANFGLPEFITQLSEFVTRMPREAPAATESEATDVVRLMTIHQSKGLEFPVVVVPDLDRSSTGQSTGVEFNTDLGALVNLKDESNKGKVANGYEFHRLLDKMADEEEKDRLLYVATTRAADYLILASSVKDLNPPHHSWMKRIAKRFDLESGELLGTLPAGYAEPEIRVTRERPKIDQRAQQDDRRQLSTILTKTQQAVEKGQQPPWPQLGKIEVDESQRQEFSFSRLSGQLAQAHDQGSGKSTIELPTSPLARMPGEIDPARLGTLVHAVLAEIDFASPGDVSTIVKRHLEGSFQKQDQEQAEATEMISRLLDSPLTKRLAEAKEIHNEVEFLLRWPVAGDPIDSLDKSPRRIRGFIDCLYRDAEDRWHVLDYKTNRTSAAGVEKVAAQYEMQMLLYGLAAEQALGVTPASLTLCFLRPGVEHSFEFDESARRRVTKQVTTAIEAARHGTVMKADAP